MATPKLYSGDHCRLNTLAHWMLPLPLIWETSVFWYIIVRLRCYSSSAYPLWCCFFAMLAVEGNQLSDPIPLSLILIPSYMSGCMRVVSLVLCWHCTIAPNLIIQGYGCALLCMSSAYWCRIAYVGIWSICLLVANLLCFPVTHSSLKQCACGIRLCNGVMKHDCWEEGIE